MWATDLKSAIEDAEYAKECSGMNAAPIVIACLLVVLHITSALPAAEVSRGRVEAQPPGIKPVVYNCTYPATGLALNVSGTMVGCGAVAGKQHTFLVKDIQTRPGISLRGARPEKLYAAFLLNPLSELGSSFVSPILHTAAGNIAGSSLANGTLGTAHTISKFFPPNPPLPGLAFQYVYLVFLQPSDAPIDWADVTKLGTMKFPIEKIAREKNLTLVASNYFSAKKAW
jgi:hypothetical protein